jgi:hypothetical protein
MKIPLLLKKNNYFLFLISLLIFIGACVNKPGVNGFSNKLTTREILLEKGPVDTAQTNSITKVHTDRKFNDIARYIAGMKGWPGSPYAKLENDSAWTRFHRNFDASWKEITISRLKPMAAWASVELANEQRNNLDIFYPLSGPDILHANAFFPDANNYHLYALERNGALPDLSEMTTKETEDYINEVYSSLGDIFTKSYFITRKMMTALNVEHVNGTLPLICVFLVRTGHEIINVQYFHMEDDGSETPLNKDSIGTQHNDLVKVYFKNNRNTSVQMVSYMKCDLSNDAYNKNLALKSYFTNMPQSTTYLKSASYLLHYAFFSSFRDLILGKSKTILEDDTGIPYKYLPRDKWDVSLYGVYVKPVDDFSGVFQTDLQSAYKDSLRTKPKRLPFSLGYHWGTNQQNLIKAQLKG